MFCYEYWLFEYGKIQVFVCFDCGNQELAALTRPNVAIYFDHSSFVKASEYTNSKLQNAFFVFSSSHLITYEMVAPSISNQQHHAVLTAFQSPALVCHSKRRKSRVRSKRCNLNFVKAHRNSRRRSTMMC